MVGAGSRRAVLDARDRRAATDSGRDAVEQCGLAVPQQSGLVRSAPSNPPDSWRCTSDRATWLDMNEEFGRLREDLQPTIEWLAQQASARKLCRALALAEGFQFQLALCNTARLSAALQVWLADEVTLERETSVEVERLSPYPLDWRAAGPSGLDQAALGELVLGGLMRGPGDGRLVFVDAARAGSRDRDAWATLLMRLNERRNGIARQLAGSLTLILPPSFDVEF